MSRIRSLADIAGFVGADGARVQELVGRSTGLASHSLAVISHPPGMATAEHHHTVADEVYFVWRGQGRLRLDGEIVETKEGDTITIRPGQRHKLWNDGPEELILIVTCAPAYAVDEVAWDE